MQEQQPARRIPIAVVAGISAAVLAAGGGAAWWARNSQRSSTAPPIPVTAQLKPTPQAVQPTPQAVQPTPQAAQPSVEKQVEIYWLKNTGDRLEMVPAQVAVKEADKSSNALEGAFNRLLAGPTDPALTSTIPKGTKLRSLKLQEDGVHINLSKEFTTGGGTASMSGRVAQVLYTATSLNPNSKVWIEVEGKKLEVLGGEGIELEQPMTRKYFEENFDL